MFVVFSKYSKNDCRIKFNNLQAVTDIKKVLAIGLCMIFRIFMLWLWVLVTNIGHRWLSKSQYMALQAVNAKSVWKFRLYSSLMRIKEIKIYWIDPDVRKIWDSNERQSLTVPSIVWRSYLKLLMYFLLSH